MEYLYIFTHIVLIMSLGWYLITNLQWYNYRLERVILKHHKWQWHITYFVAPIVLFHILDSLYFAIYFYLVFMTSFVLWNKKLDRPLVLTGRVKRFLLILLFVTFAMISLCLASQKCNSSAILFIPLILSYTISYILEKILFMAFKRKAKDRLATIPSLKTIAITASYGKTSIKNYLYHVLKKKFKVYKTPRSVNTIGGIVLDVNRDLPLDTQIYIAEAGARQSGDIEEITSFLEPEYCVLGSVGEQHIEYFKTLDNIIHTKMEILTSPKMIKGFVHESVPIKDYETIVKFPENLHVTMSNLDGIWFDIVINGKQEHFSAPILGSFNAINLTAVILVAHELGMSIDEIKMALSNLPQVEHRLQKIEAGGKIIIDDSFNGNLEGMLEAIHICSHHEGRKVIVTPGLVESTSEANILLANEINEKFDYAIITGSLNAQLLSSNIDNEKLFVLKDKSELENTLATKTQAGDLILFANDAPNFI
ncbi:UDP-N-acetylmuramoylalanyl-D-glutamyl-2, 6-diaminopimelate--D-alanyl-D-alanine ligase [Halarcobacter ebronensis]|uniref:UDP-N-acetylmuramoylalanyl-D-glutamyl-2, 6-diaminopimelate--D-alanyl-D-alanine ligase n=1 Tax=Halarcobacter ebronensis TaxID=1462615 RepID=A0A4Q0YAP5_9BACT|nr:UDP-N-acetylmuramoyl-tripeptide--D-alanyl-D-alanine ligase [Halarcobacter ebronensis]QKF81422.1 D-alanyl-D-alanine-adding enzyme [Halarcobacter ebronensis]RXJ67387.1 UDP-N-acetylmuramoylalanyl-D-glutamyl-2, 6-diaminopimelate--D-alanyl-D-alanine ligase [Halarcobacter ebronensis]RXK01818.1 UDP-N-acetylmuramoylalanyl-D-glutamyl-2, 6-diaminopimelate--D-alanyl-D-alanine ligase [Halarcobacter ebronensis]